MEKQLSSTEGTYFAEKVPALEAVLNKTSSFCTLGVGRKRKWLF